MLGPESIKFLQITIDGEKEYHDKRRIHYKDGKSFDKIIANISKALKTGVSISVRANTDGRNISSMRNLKNYFYELGFYNYKTFSFYSALLCGEKSDVDKVKKNTQTSELNKKFEYLSREEFLLKQEQNDSDIWGQDYGVFTKIYRALKNSSKIQFHTIFCPSQTNSYILDPYGEIYSCWDTVGKRERCLGSYGMKKNGVYGIIVILGLWQIVLIVNMLCFVVEVAWVKSLLMAEVLNLIFVTVIH